MYKPSDLKKKRIITDHNATHHIMAHFTLGVYALGRSEATHSSTTSTLRQLKIWGQVSEKRKYASLDGPPIPPGPWPSSLKRCFYRDSACSPLQPANPVPQEPHGQIWTWDSRSPSREFRWRYTKTSKNLGRSTSWWNSRAFAPRDTLCLFGSMSTRTMRLASSMPGLKGWTATTDIHTNLCFFLSVHPYKFMLLFRLPISSYIYLPTDLSNLSNHLSNLIYMIHLINLI